MNLTYGIIYFDNIVDYFDQVNYENLILLDEKLGNHCEKKKTWLANYFLPFTYESYIV